MENVVVTQKSGQPVAGLARKDFTLLDNKAPRAIVSFRAIASGQEPMEVILLVDNVNAVYTTVSSERQQLENFLRANEGRLAHPTALAIMTDTGTQLQRGFTSDGNALAGDLDKAEIGLRSNRNSSGFYGAVERYQLSIDMLGQLVAREAARPGRKVIVWVSPGWPILSSTTENLSDRDERRIFAQVVTLSNELRRADITLYNVNPLGNAESVAGMFQYEDYLKGVAKPTQVDIGDLSLQVLATQSGGLVLNSNDVAGMLARCLEDTTAYYQIGFDPPPAEHADEYHSLQIKLAEPNLTARTRTGYYSQP